MKLLDILEEISGFKNATEFKAISQNGLNFIKCKEGFISKLKPDVQMYKLIVFSFIIFLLVYCISQYKSTNIED